MYTTTIQVTFFWMWLHGDGTLLSHMIADGQFLKKGRFAMRRYLILPYLVIKLREAITTINSDFVKSFKSEGGEKSQFGCLSLIHLMVLCFSFILFMLMDTLSRNGREVWVSLNGDYIWVYCNKTRSLFHLQP
ncbi:hypothetical protein CR513_54718, partial [Mucuna pruriens]